MEQKTQRTLAYCITGILFVVGLISYTAFATKAPEEPVRIFFTSIGGSVLFDHKGHASDSGYGIACKDCHHELEEVQDAPKKADAFHKVCIDCHKEGGEGPVDCRSCHML